MAETADGTPHTGVPEIDGEHVMQIRLLLALEKALHSSNRTAALDLMSRLDDVTAAHFESEQTLMRLYAYSGVTDHEKAHGQLLGELRRLSKRVASEEPRALPPAAAEVRQWLIDHMQTADRAFAAFVRQLTQSSVS